MRWLEQYWYRIATVHLLLWPLSVLFAAIAGLRRVLYRQGLLRVTRSGVPVIVIGNIGVGGTGKTPLVIWLAEFLRGRGFAPGVVCRGYGGAVRAPREATTNTDPYLIGDEAVLLARRTGCPVWTGARRGAAVRALLAAHAECDLVISDDGLQHYALARDCEIIAIDGERGFGNGMLLPAGPLRESPARLAGADALVINGPALFLRETLPPAPPVFDMELSGAIFYNLLDAKQSAGPADFAGRAVHAVAAIGNPHHFFNHLQLLGMAFTPHPFPDHHMFSAADLSFRGDDVVIMTEKDAVKCAQFATTEFWVLRVDARVEAGLGELILRKLESNTRGS